MATNRAFGKDSLLYLMSSGTPVTVSAAISELKVGVTGRIIIGVIEVESLALSSPVTESYKLKFQQCATSGGVYTDIPGSEVVIDSVATFEVQFRLDTDKPYVRAYLTLADSSSPQATSIDGDIFLTATAGSDTYTP